MKRWQRGALFCLLVIAAPLLFAVATYAGAWYYRIQAQKLLACVHALRPGVTTEAEFLKAIQPLELKVSDHREVAKDNPSKITYDYEFYNFPNWVVTLFNHIPGRVIPVVCRLMLNWTMFSVSLQFEGGKLTKLVVFEFQGEGHPFSGHVTIYAGRTSMPEVLWAEPEKYRGYFVQSPDLFEDSKGRPLTRPVPFHRNVWLDERATSEQRRRALEFHLECFTSLRGCLDASRILQPVPGQ